MYPYVGCSIKPFVQIVSAATRSQANYKVYQEMAEVFDDNPRAMLEFEVRRALPSGAARQRPALHYR